MEENQNSSGDNKKDMIIGILGLIGMAIFTIVGVIIKNIFFVG